MWDWIEREAVYLWYYLDIQIRQIAPYWALGIVLGSAVSVFGKKTIHDVFVKTYEHIQPDSTEHRFRIFSLEQSHFGYFQ